MLGEPAVKMSANPSAAMRRWESAAPIVCRGDHRDVVPFGEFLRSQRQWKNLSRRARFERCLKNGHDGHRISGSDRWWLLVLNCIAYADVVHPLITLGRSDFRP